MMMILTAVEHDIIASGNEYLLRQADWVSLGLESLLLAHDEDAVTEVKGCRQRGAILSLRVGTPCRVDGPSTRCVSLHALYTEKCGADGIGVYCSDAVKPSGLPVAYEFACCLSLRCHWMAISSSSGRGKDTSA